MKTVIFLIVLGALPSAPLAINVSPIEKVIQMMDDLAAKVIKEGEESHAVFAEFSEWCEDKSKNLGFEIKTAKAEIADLTATIEDETAKIDELDAKIEELAGEIATDEADLKAATEIREKEFADFSAQEKELVDIVSMLSRAIKILKEEMAKSGSASMLQIKEAHNVVDALKLLVQGSFLSNADGTKLTAMVQMSDSSDESEDDEEAGAGAPDAAVYEGQSGKIIATLEELLSKAETELDTARKTEMTDKNNYELLKQTLENEIKTGNKDTDKAKKGKAASAEKKAQAEGDLETTNKELKADVAALSDLHHNCMDKASDFEAEQKSREEELKAVATAKKLVVENTKGAAGQEYSFLQVTRSKISSKAGLSHFEAVRFIRDLGRKHKSAALTQLASRMAYAMRFGSSSGDDPFAKVKGLITDMIAKLEDEAEKDATEKAYCDKELSETNTKKEDKEGEIEKLSTAIDQKSAKSEKLKEQVAVLQKELADLAKSQKEMDDIRTKENALYLKNKAEMEQGIKGVTMALKVLRDYYGKADKAHNAGDGAGAGIIGMLEVVESDFSKSLAEMIATEESAVTEYEQETKDNEVEKTTKTQDVKYKTQESVDLDKAVAEATEDRSGVQSELDSVMDTLKSLEERCIAKPETYEERKARMEAEIAGLKEGLAILEGEASTVLLEKSHTVLRSRRLRA